MTVLRDSHAVRWYSTLHLIEGGREESVLLYSVVSQPWRPALTPCDDRDKIPVARTFTSTLHISGTDSTEKLSRLQQEGVAWLSMVQRSSVGYYLALGCRGIQKGNLSLEGWNSAQKVETQLRRVETQMRSVKLRRLKLRRLKLSSEGWVKLSRMHHCLLECSVRDKHLPQSPFTGQFF